MKQAVSEHIHPHRVHRVRWDDVREHTVPLQDLVQDYPVKKAAQAHSQQNPRPGGFPVLFSVTHKLKPLVSIAT
jgi:hypothetical protein